MLSSKLNYQNDPLWDVAEVELHYKHKVKPSDRPKVTSSRNAFELFIKMYNPMTLGHRESFYVMLLNQANRVLGILKISEGGMTGTVVDIRFIFQAALLCNARGIIVSHNHPSGNTQPSDADKRITRNIKDGCGLLDLELKDHIIVTPEDTYFSFADEGLL